MESVKQEFAFLSSLMKSLSLLFGSKCEVVLHDHKDHPYEHTIVAIENGHVTGRKVGDYGTSLGLKVLRANDKIEDNHNYTSQTTDGKILRSSTIFIRDNDDKVIGALCINFDISDLILAEKALNSLCQNPLVPDPVENNGVEDIFSGDINELIDSLIWDSQRAVGKPVVSMTKEDKILALQYLDKRGAFLVKKSGEKVAKFFNISKYTMYSYLDSLRTQTGEGRINGD
jgi:predicted transcriptional regulator YheO